jgi:hypothetical protein
MFKFDFGIEDDGTEPLQAETAPPEVLQSEPFAELSLSQLVRLLVIRRGTLP